MEAASQLSSVPQHYQSVDGLKNMVHSKSLTEEQKIAEATRQFEAVMLRFMLKDSLKPMIKGYLNNDVPGGQIYHDMIVDKLSQELTKGDGFGMSEALRKQVTPQVLNNKEAAASSQDAKESSPLRPETASEPEQTAQVKKPPEAGISETASENAESLKGPAENSAAPRKVSQDPQPEPTRTPAQPASESSPQEPTQTPASQPEPAASPASAPEAELPRPSVTDSRQFSVRERFWPVK